MSNFNIEMMNDNLFFNFIDRFCKKYGYCIFFFFFFFFGESTVLFTNGETVYFLGQRRFHRYFDAAAGAPASDELRR